MQKYAKKNMQKKKIHSHISRFVLVISSNVLLVSFVMVIVIE